MARQARTRPPGRKTAPPPSPLERPVWRHAALLAGIVGLVWMAYANSFHAPLLLDNRGIILQDTRIHAVTAVNLHRILAGQYWPTANTGLYRPLVTLSYLFDYAILGHGSDPAGYHWLNFLLHAVNLVLVYLLGLALFERTAAAVILSAVWGLHPLLTESITNVVGRADLLAALGVLAALLCHRRALREGGARRAAWLAAIGLAVAIGIFSKESAIVAPAVLLITDFLFSRESSWKARLPGYAAAALPCLLYLYVRSQVLAGSAYQATPFCENPLLGAGFWSARLTAIKVIGEYFGLLLWPARLSWDYSYQAVPLSGWGDFGAMAALGGCAAALGAAIRVHRTHRTAAFAVAFFFTTLAPTSNLLLLIGTIKAERFLYLPSVGFAIGLVWALDLLGARLPSQRGALRYAVGALLLALAVRTYARNADWADPGRFWLSGAEAAPESYKTQMAAATGVAPADDAQVARAVRAADRSLEILDGLPDSRNASVAYRDGGVFYRNMGDRAASAGDSAGARNWYRKSLAALLRSERIELAWEERYRAENAARGKPDLTSLPSQLYLDLGRTWLRLDDPARAQAALERGRTLESSPPLLEELASIYQTAGDAPRAAAALVEALAVDPQRSDLIPRLVDLYGRIDPAGCAVSREGGAVSLNQDCPLVHRDICSASQNVIANYLRRGQQYEAEAIRKVAVHDLGCR